MASFVGKSAEVDATKQPQVISSPLLLPPSWSAILETIANPGFSHDDCLPILTFHNI